jgi:protein arginine N-methyltransferase 2
LPGLVGMQAELILGVVARREKKVGEGAEKPYLQQRVEYSEGKLLDEENKGVMMAWENPLMAAHAKAICATGGHVLNVGFGMGLVDSAIQSHHPASHTIIEAHPEVHKRMLETGWGEKPNVRILFGRWQDVLPQLDSYDGELPSHQWFF